MLLLFCSLVLAALVACRLFPAAFVAQRNRDSRARGEVWWWHRWPSSGHRNRVDSYLNACQDWWNRAEP